MRLIIDIMKDVYINALNDDLCGNAEIVRAIKNGIPLEDSNLRDDAIAQKFELIFEESIRSFEHKMEIRNGLEKESFYEYAVFSDMGAQASGLFDTYEEAAEVAEMLRKEYPSKSFKIYQRLLMRWERSEG